MATKRRVSNLTNMRIKEISLVDDPASPGSDIILTKNAAGERMLLLAGLDLAKLDTADEMDNDGESESVSAQDNRTPAECDADLRRVAQAATASPPAPTETFDDWAARVYGDAIDGLDDTELALAQRLYSTMRASTVTKARADATVDELAKSRAAADPSKSYAQHYTAILHENPQLYVAMREHEAALVGAPLAKAAGDADAGSALDRINARADALVKSSDGKITFAKAFTQVCATDPALYRRYRDEK